MAVSASFYILCAWPIRNRLAGYSSSSALHCDLACIGRLPRRFQRHHHSPHRSSNVLHDAAVCQPASQAHTKILN
jgi:hypothetical protein